MHLNNELELKLKTEALHYLRLGRYQPALACLKELLSIASNNSYYHYLLAYCYYGLELYSEAINACQTALAMNYSEERIYDLLGEIYIAMREYCEAESALLTVLKLNPVHAEAMAAYGYLMFLTGHEKKALQLLDEALRLEPENDSVLHYNFIRYLAKDEVEQELQMIKRLMVVGDDEVKKLIWIGLKEYHSDNYRAAYESFRQAFLLDPTNKLLLEYLETSKRLTRPWMQPLLWVEKIGGGAVLWLLMMGLTVLFYYLKQPALVVGVLVTYILFAVYSWIVTVICKMEKRG